VVSNAAYLNTLYTLLYTVPGIPSVYYGSEWGIQGVKKNGSDQEIRPYINIENRSAYNTWLTEHISKLAQIRQREKALKYGSYEQVYLEYNCPFVFGRSCENERILVAVNIADAKKSINLSKCGSGGFFDLLSEERVDSGNIEMKPYSARILKAV